MQTRHLETFGVKFVDVFNHALHETLQRSTIRGVHLCRENGVQQPRSVSVPCLDSKQGKYRCNWLVRGPHKKKDNNYKICKYANSKGLS